MQLVFEKNLPKGLFDFALTGMCFLPTLEPNGTDNFIEIVDYAFDHDGRVAISCLLKQLGQRSFTSVNFFFLGATATAFARGIGILLIFDLRTLPTDRAQ
jgi:hypothetical protein